MEFKLPIQYIKHESVDAHVIQDLELIDSEETSVYDKLFLPKTDESKSITREWAKYYTTDEQFLKQSITLFKSSIHKANISEFVTDLNDIQENKEFKIKYQYVETNWLATLNTSPFFLLLISIYLSTTLTGTRPSFANESAPEKPVPSMLPPSNHPIECKMLGVNRSTLAPLK